MSKNESKKNNGADRAHTKPGETHQESHGSGSASGSGHGDKLLSGDIYSFTVLDGAVTTASMKLSSGTTVSMPLNTGIVYSVSGSDIVATRSTSQAIDTIVYRDTNANGLYEIVANAQVETTVPTVNMQGFVSREQLKMTLGADGVVTGVSQLNGKGGEKVLLSAAVSNSSTSWTVQQNLLVETSTSGSGLARWEIFRDGNKDGIYTEVAHGTGPLIDLTGVVTATNAVVASL
jgi:hypothetical protein